MRDLLELIDFRWPDAAVRIVPAADATPGEPWPGAEKSDSAMQAALDTLVEWSPGAEIPSGADARGAIDAWRAHRALAELEAGIGAALGRIDTLAEAARAQWITLGSGQALVYEAKRREAEAWVVETAAAATHNHADYPWMLGRAARLNAAAEADVTQAQMQAVADEWAAKAAAWIAAGIAIDTVREAAKSDVASAADAASVDAIVAGITWPAPE